MKRLSKAQKSKFLKNAWKFTAPAVGVLFAQLALGVPLREASLVALLALYGLLADFLKKAK